MAGEIGKISGAAVEALPSPIVASSHRSNAQRHHESGASIRSTPRPATSADGLQDDYPADRTSLASILERAQNAALANTTSMSFERDDADGKMYLYIKDKRTGEDLYRIPKKYLAATDPKPGPGHTVDVHI
jgi:uncharacterized FlaG/YvyC family protein